MSYPRVDSDDSLFLAFSICVNGIGVAYILQLEKIAQLILHPWVVLHGQEAILLQDAFSRLPL